MVKINWKKFVLRVSFIKWLVDRAINEPSWALCCSAKYKSAWARIEPCKLGSGLARNFSSSLARLAQYLRGWQAAIGKGWELYLERTLCTTSSVFRCGTYVKESVEELFTLDLSRIENVSLLKHREPPKASACYFLSPSVIAYRILKRKMIY